VTFLTFFLIHSVPGGPFDAEKEIPVEIRQQLNEKYGLDKPFFTQYCNYIKGVFEGDLGPSYKYVGWNVSELIGEKVIVSFELGVYSMLFALFLGILSGVFCVWFEKRPLDIGLSFLSTLGLCLPAFIVGPLLIYVFGLKLKILDVAGWEHWHQKILPTITIGVLYASYILRLTKSGLNEVMKQHYILAARARGLSEKRIFFIHALKNGLRPVIAYMGPTFAGIISGAIITETIFQIPGLGRLFIRAIANRDDMLILGIVNFYALAVIICNTITDCIQAWINPKIRLQ
jgi:oligopeptide transport system permease protein